MNDPTKKRIGVYFDDETLRLSDAGVKLTRSRNRSEFLTDAVKVYTAILTKEHISDVLTPALESVIHATIQNTEDRIAKVVYKDSVATAMMMHLMAEVYDIDVARLNEIRSVCVQEVNRLNGKFKFEDAVNFEG